MAIARKIERELLRNEYLQTIIDSFLALDETVLRVTYPLSARIKHFLFVFLTEAADLSY